MQLRTSTDRTSLLAIATALVATAALVVLLPGGFVTKKETGLVSAPTPSATNELVAEFEGNEFASDGQLQSLIMDFIDQEQIASDVDRIMAYYRSFGFFQATVGRIPEPYDDSKRMTLRFVIEEGPRYLVENVSFMGNKVFASESLAMGINLPGGQPFDQAKMKRDVSWLKELYGSQGYVFADIQAEPVFLEETGKLNLLYRINEGKRWRIGNIIVHVNDDNPLTKIQTTLNRLIQTALNRISLRAGEIVDSREIMASEQRLQACGLFIVDPIRGVAPKITYHIRELGEEQLASQAAEHCGQSPDAPGPLSYQYSYQVPAPSCVPPGDDGVNMHVWLAPQAAK